MGSAPAPTASSRPPTSGGSSVADRERRGRPTCDDREVTILGVCIELTDQAVAVRFTGVDRWWALSSGIVLPTWRVLGARVLSRSAAIAACPARELPGLGWPGVLRAGCYGIGQDRQLWLVHRAVSVLGSTCAASLTTASWSRSRPGEPQQRHQQRDRADLPPTRGRRHRPLDRQYLSPRRGSPSLGVEHAHPSPTTAVAAARRLLTMTWPTPCGDGRHV